MGTVIKANRQQAVGLLERRAPFEASALSASWKYVSEGMSIGLMGGHEFARLLDFAQGTPDALVYVVYSYATPIAWADEQGRKGFTGESYSPTTSRHMGIARRGL